jgi:hypothetical protein
LIFFLQRGKDFYRIHLLQLLAFVLETSWKSIQGELFYFFSIIFHFNLIHTGNYYFASK